MSWLILKTLRKRENFSPLDRTSFCKGGSTSLQLLQEEAIASAATSDGIAKATLPTNQPIMCASRTHAVSPKDQSLVCEWKEMASSKPYQFILNVRNMVCERKEMTQHSVRFVKRSKYGISVSLYSPGSTTLESISPAAIVRNGGWPMRKNGKPVTDHQKFAENSFDHKNTSAAPAKNPCHVIM